jgi:general secretion pathway protein D
MLYSRERSLFEVSTPGGVLPSSCNGLDSSDGLSGGCSSPPLVKDTNEVSMVRGDKAINTRLIHRQKARTVNVLPLALLAGLGALAGFAPVAAHAQSAATWSKRGTTAEARELYDEAYEDYRQAHLKKPKDLRYKSHFERIRFLAASAHIDRGRVLKGANDPGGALVEFRRALEIDPSSQTAQQEIDILQAAAQASTPLSPAALEQMSGQKKTLKELSSVAGPIELQPTSNDPITIHAVEDVKNIYQAIGKEAGLNILFDPDYTSKRIPVDLVNVSLSDALRIVGTLAGTFYKPVTSNTIFVAQNTRTKHTDLDQEAVQTFYLTNASQQNDANEIQTAIRNLLDPSTKIYLVPSQNAIVMRATPDQLLLAQKLINDLDHTRSEVVVDVAVLEVSKNWERKLGISLPQSISLTPQASPSTSTSSTTTTGSNFTLNTLAHLNATNFAVTLGGGELDALLNDSDTRVLQNPRIRATDGQPATLKIGSKIPIATGSYSSGVSTGTVSLGVQTQFTYIDVGVNIAMTPTVHYDHEIGLKLKIEVSTQSNTVTISGVTEPVISQRSIEQVIQLKEGEPSVLAGILTKSDGSALTGTPGLSQIPLLKYIFGSTDKTIADDEIVFLLIPHIVRESVLTQLNTRAIDTGTGQSIELRHDAASVDNSGPLQPVVTQSAGPATTAASAAAAMVGQLGKTTPQQPAAQPAGQPLPGAQPAASGPPVSFNIQPGSSNQTVGSTFQVAVSLANGRDIFAVPLQLQFNSAVLDLVNVDAGDFLGRDGQAVSLVHRDEGNGLVTISTSRPPGVAGVSGQGGLCVLTFKAKAAGDSQLSLVKVGARNSTQANLPATGSQAVVHVQ